MEMKYSTDTPVLLDTTVFSFLLKRNDSRAALYLPDIQGKLIAVSFVTVGEVYKWAYYNHWSSKRIQELEEKLQTVIILPIHNEVARRWAYIKIIPGRGCSDNDAWIAASAMVYGCVLATHDSDFIDLPGLKIICHLR
jgi:tRNA(fMet)-specific endonuclease VapC